MSDQPNKSGGGNPSGNNNNQNNNQRRNNNRRRHHNNNRPRENGQNAQGQQGQQAQQGQNQPRPQHAQGQNPNQQRRRPHHNNNNQNRPRHPQQGQGQQQNPPGGSLERIYEKYLNLLDQHLIARRKYHDMYYRSEGAQKAKLERNFYNTLNDVREFENKLTPETRALFEKRNNGYQLDRTYTSNHEIPVEGDIVPNDLPPAEPHLLQSQIAADYSNDTEESVGTAEDYLRYKGL